MTAAAELQKEWDVTYQTALGRSCEDREPSEEQKRTAKKEADEHILDFTTLI